MGLVGLLLLCEEVLLLAAAWPVVLRRLAIIVFVHLRLVLLDGTSLLGILRPYHAMETWRSLWTFLPQISIDLHLLHIPPLLAIENMILNPLD